MTFTQNQLEKIYKFIIKCQTGINNDRWQQLYTQYRRGVYDYFLKTDNNFNYVNTDETFIIKGSGQGLENTIYNLNYNVMPNTDIMPQYYLISGDNHVYFFMIIRYPDNNLYYIEFNPSGKSKYDSLVDIFPENITEVYDDISGYPIEFIKTTNERINHYFSNNYDYQSETNDYCCSIYSSMSYYLAKSVLHNGNLDIFLSFIDNGFTLAQMNTLIIDFLQTINTEIINFPILYQACLNIINYSEGGNMRKKNRRVKKVNMKKVKKELASRGQVRASR